MPAPQESGRSNVVVSAIERAKRHPVVVVVVALVGLLLFLTTVGDLYGRISGVVNDLRNPHEEDYKRLAELDLGVTPGYLEEWLGKAQRSVNACQMVSCPPEAAGQTLTLSMYESDFVAVRALFVDSSLKWYAITLLSDELEPPMTWLDHDLGTLGKVTYADAFGVPGIEPTDVDMFLGPQSSAYVEIVAAGAPGNYRGLLLGFAPTGRDGPGSFDLESADIVLQLNETSFDAEIARPFRSRSYPNTFGEFVDDGEVVSKLAGNAEFHRVLLYSFTSL
jgi:hypothetical protein